MEIRDRVRIARKTLGKTQAEFAETLNITQRGYGAMETGANSFQPKYLEILIAEYHISRKFIFEGIGDPIENIEKDEMSNYITEVYQYLPEDKQKALVEFAKFLKAQEDSNH